MEEQQIELRRILGIDKMVSEYGYSKKEPTPASWAEIYEAIGKLKERALNTQKEIVYIPRISILQTTGDPNLHYHNGIACRNNPCVWC